MSTFTDMHGETAEVRTIGFADYRRYRNSSDRSKIYRVGSGEAMFWLWAGLHYNNKREAELNFATSIYNLTAYRQDKIRNF